MQSAWQRMRLIQKLDALEVAHTAHPSQLRGELLRELSPAIMTPAKKAFDSLRIAAEANATTRADRTPAFSAAAEQIAAAKKELGIT